MDDFINGYKLKIFLGESDKHDHMPLYEWVLKQAMEHKLAGGTVIRGLSGYGSHSQIHSAKILSISCDLPIIIEFNDTVSNIEKFLPTIDEAIKDGLVTLENIQLKIYKSSK